MTYSMETDSSRPDLIYQIPSIVDPIALGDLFPSPQPLEVELGSGDGSFLVQHATFHPEHNFIGVERLLGRLRKIDKKGRRAGLKNLRLLRIEAAYFLEYLLPPSSVSALHIYFPDPWPKRRHRKNRLINEGFPQLARKILQPGGKVFMRTDDADYFEQMARVFHGQAFFQPTTAPEGLLSLLTDFERGFRRQGLPIFNLARELHG